MTLAEQVLDAMAKKHCYKDWKSFRKKLTKFQINTALEVVDLALSAKQAEVLKEIDRLKPKDKYVLDWNDVWTEEHEIISFTNKTERKERLVELVLEHQDHLEWDCRENDLISSEDLKKRLLVKAVEEKEFEELEKEMKVKETNEYERTTYGEISFELFVLSRKFYGLNRKSNLNTTQQIIAIALKVVAKERCFSKKQRLAIISSTELFPQFSFDDLVNQKKAIETEIKTREECRDC